MHVYVTGAHTFSMCFSSPLVKFSISSAFLIRTVPLVSVCAISIGFVKTATFAFVTFFTSPNQVRTSVRPQQTLGSYAPSGSLPNTIPCTTLLPAKLPPMILTTRTLSTLKALLFSGITDRAASATSPARMSSHPYCFDAIEGMTARARAAFVNGDGSLLVDKASGRYAI
jgi:hypothetical protein